jgi:hypothetical protein
MTYQRYVEEADPGVGATTPQALTPARECTMLKAKATLHQSPADFHSRTCALIHRLAEAKGHMLDADRVSEACWGTGPRHARRAPASLLCWKLLSAIGR